jgi:hypothetical protein
MRMGRPEAARAALDDALRLGEELTVKHQSIYLVDLATTYTQEREPEEACRLVLQSQFGALSLVVAAASGGLMAASPHRPAERESWPTPR